MNRSQAMVEKAPVIWYLVADARRARVYMRERVEKRLPLANYSRRNQTLDTVAHMPFPVSGMAWESEAAAGLPGPDDTAPLPDSPQAEKHRFARMVAEQINQARLRRAFTRLVLIAPAKMLGELKKHLSESSLDALVAELPKDLTHYEGEALEQHLAQIS